LKADRFNRFTYYFYFRIIDLNTIYENLTVEDEIEMQKYHHLELEKNIVEIANDFNSA
jgi:hypothetical protein